MPDSQRRWSDEGPPKLSGARTEFILHQRGDAICALPDVRCNAGGLIVSYFEWAKELQRLAHCRRIGV
ncbi:hypothetical protein [Bradyrhizobium sp. BR 1433]|uniref:hypothetical protein n=1 Tax=Bradyrhizobium sp. BR 1433 TaxID=3447967 RepID=UPI003EE541D8